MKNEKKKIMLFVPILLVFTLFLISLVSAQTMTLNPNANGTYTQFYVVPASLQHWDAVSEPSVNTSDYITIGINNKTDTFNFQNTNISYVPIDSVTLYARCYRNSSTQNKFYLLIKSGSKENLSTLITGGSSYSTYSFVLTKDPATNQPWTQTGVNNLEGGIRTNGTGGGARCAWLYITVQYPDAYEYLAYDYKKAVFTIGGGMNLTSLQDYSCDWGNASSPWKRCHIITEIDSSRSQFTIRKSMILMNMPIESQNYTYYSTRNYTNFTKNFTTNYRYTNNVSCNSTPYNLTVCDDNNVTTIDTCREENATSRNEICWHVYNITTGYLARSFYNWTEFGDNLIVDPGVSSLRVDFDVPKYNGTRFNISAEGYELDPTVSACGVLGNVGELYILNQSVTADGTCFNVTADDVILDCNGSNINFASVGGTGRIYGVYTNAARTTIQNCNIYQRATTASTTGIWAGGGSATITNNTFTMKGDAGDDTTDAIRIASDSNVLRNNTINGTSAGYLRYAMYFSGDYNNATNTTFYLYKSYDVAFYMNGGDYNNINLTNIYLLAGSSSMGVAVTTSTGNNNFTNIYVLDNVGNNGYFYWAWASSNDIIKDVFINNTGSTEFSSLLTKYGCSAYDYLINVTTVNVLSQGNFNYGGVGYKRYWYADTYVNDTSGNPLNATNVSIYNVSGALINTQLTNTSGYTPTRQTLLQYMQNETSIYYETNYSFNGTLTGYADNAVAVNLTTNRLAGTNPVVITLSGISAVDALPIVTLNSPIAYFNSSSQSITFNCTASDDINLTNVTLYGNWSSGWHANQTNTTPINNTPTIFTKTIPDGKYVWNCQAGDNKSQYAFATSNRTFTIDSTDPTIDIVYPANNSNSSDYGLNVNFTTYDVSGIDECWWSDDYGATNTSNPSCDNLTGSWVAGSNTIWVWVNDTLGNEARDDITFFIDATAPVVTLPVYTNLTKYNNTQSMIFNISAIDAGVGSSYCSINVNGGTNQTIAVSSNWCNGTYALTGLANGNYTINAYANDTLGNTGLNNSYMVWIDNPVAISCVGAIYNFSCGENVNESCTMNGNMSATATCFSVNTANVVLDCNGYTINYSSSTNGSGVSTNSANTTVKNCIIKETTATESTYSYGINFSNTVNGTAFNNNITTLGIRSHALKLDGSNSTLLYSNILLPKGNLSHSIDLNYSYNNLIRNNNLTSINPFYCTALTYYQSGNNTFTNNTAYVACYDGAGLDDVNSFNNTFSYNIVNTTTYNTHAMYLSGCNNETVFNNSFYTSGESNNAIHLLNTDNSNVSYNYASASDSGAGIVIISSDNNSVSDNYFYSGQDGVAVYFDTGSSNNNLTRNNHQTTQTGTQGILFTGTGTTNNLIKDSTINSVQSNDVWTATNGINNFTNCTFNKSDTYISGTGSINVFWYADAYVNSSTGTALENANVSIYDVNVVLINTQLTNSSGYIPLRQTLREYRQNATAQYFDTNYSFNGTLTGYTDNAVAVNLTGNRIGTNPVVITLTASGGDTCTYSGSGNWIINCADNCVFTTTQTIPTTNNISAYGTGTLRFNSGGYWNFNGTYQFIKLFSGCTLAINSGGGII